MAHLVDTDTGDRCALLMSRGATRAQRLGGVLRDSRLLSDPRADGDAGSAMQDMIAQLSEGAGKDAFWGDAAAPRSRPAAAALDNPRLAAFALRDANAHLARVHPHPLRRVAPSQVYPHLNGGWACDECNGTSEGEVWHCFVTGNFDLCDACFEAGRGFADGELDDEPLPSLDGPPAAELAAAAGAGAAPEPEAAEVSRQQFFDMYRKAPALKNEGELVGGPAPPRPAGGGAEAGAAAGSTEDAERMRLTKLFHKIDADHSGTVDTRELFEGFSAAGMRISKTQAKRLMSKADADGGGELELDEFIEAFGGAERHMEWGPDELVYAAAELTAVTETAIMRREDVNARVWQYIEKNELASPPLAKPVPPEKCWIEWDKPLMRIFVPPDPEAAADEEGGKKEKKKKKGKKDEKAPGVSRWDLECIMDETLDKLLTAVYRPRGGAAQSGGDMEDGGGIGEGGEVPRERTRVADAPLKLSPRSAYVDDVGKARLAPLPLVGKISQNKLDLHRYGLGQGQSAALAAALEHVHDLTSVDLSHNKMPDLALASVIGSLSRKKKLEELHLAYNDAGRETARALEHLIGQPLILVGLRTLDLADCKLGCGGTKALATGLLGSATLLKLSLRSNNVGAVGAASLGEALAQNNVLTDLDVAHNVMRGKGAIALAQSLRENKTLRKLDVSWNCLHDTAGEEFGAALAENTGLRFLDLSQNGLRERSAQLLATAFQTNETILDLQLNKNAFGLEGGRALMGALRLLGESRVMGLAGCNFGDSSGERTAAEGSAALLFDATKPAGSYNLKLADSYDRMIANELMRVGSSSLNPAWKNVRFTGTLNGTVVDGKLMVQCRGAENPLPDGCTHTGCRCIQPVAPKCVECGLSMKKLIPVELVDDPPAFKKKQKDEDAPPPQMKPVGKVLNTFPDDPAEWTLPEEGRLQLEFSDEAIIPVELTPMPDVTFQRLLELVEVAEDVDGDGDIDEEDIAAALAENPEADERLLDIM